MSFMIKNVVFLDEMTPTLLWEICLVAPVGSLALLARPNHVSGLGVEAPDNVS